MNILFISNLSQSQSTGPVWSVPARIKAQSQIDNVLWINLSDAYHEHWNNVDVYTNYKSYNKVELSSLPSPFNSPDVVVFEGFYGGLKEIKIAKECQRRKIKYVIVPRCSLTWNAMHNKSRFKKEIAHFFFYDSFVKKSSAVQYLTKKEYEDSKYRFNVNHFIISNGVIPRTIVKHDFSKNAIKAVYVARIDIYHKGMDLLLEACSRLQNELRKANFQLTVYGPLLKDYYAFEKLINQYGINDIIALGGEVKGNKKEDVLLNSDIFILTSRMEGHPMGLIEALSYGVPCLITEGTNIATEVGQFNCGFTSPTTVDGILNSLEFLIKQVNQLPEMGRNALRLTEAYDWNYLAQKFHDELSKL